MGRSPSPKAVTEPLVAEHRRGFRRRWYRTPTFVAGVLILGTIVRDGHRRAAR